MAEVFKGRIKQFKNVEEVVARHVTAQEALDKHALKLGIKAEKLLNQRASKRSGDSYIDIEKGHVDRYVVLNDERGYGAAMSIEYGHGPTNDNGTGSAPGLWILHDAAGLPRKFDGGEV